MKTKQKYNQARQDFLLSFFNNDKYEEKEVNGFYLVKQWNNNNKSWQVAIYTKESFQKYKDFKNYPLLFSSQIDHIRKIVERN